MKRLTWIISLLVIITLLVVNACKDGILQPIGLGSEATMSTPILQLGESWTGNLDDLLDVTVHYDTLSNTVYGTVTNISSMKLCWGLSEPHMKLGSQTVGELGPEMLGHLNPGQQVDTSLSVFDDPRYTGYQFDGYVLHLEMYDCSGGAPDPY